MRQNEPDRRTGQACDIEGLRPARSCSGSATRQFYFTEPATVQLVDNNFLMKFQLFVAVSCAALFLLGCVTDGGTATEMVTATSGMRGLIQAQEPPSSEDYALTCDTVNTRC
jgi:hypothetical protein